MLLGGAVNVHADTETGKVVNLTPFSAAGGQGSSMVWVASSAMVKGSGVGTARCFPNFLDGVMTLDVSSLGGQALYSLLLAAAVAGQDVKFNYSLSSGSCTLTSAGIALSP